MTAFVTGANYTRKSTDHGLELELNSLHAQRCRYKGYITSQPRKARSRRRTLMPMGLL